ncbi:MAG: J domain-containing protein [Cyanothece sp. SIO1E1]|nr:J domain-containing protein [Cyanothece sp. SIO1E1]
MPETSFSSDWLENLSDPYALLGISVTADDRRVLKRYRNVAKLLHPDRYATTNTEQKDLASQLFARLVNPAYQKLKQDKDRAETLATLRFRVRRVSREGEFALKSEVARKLMNTPVQQAEIFYEQAITKISESQYSSLERFEQITQQLGELNLAYLRLKMGDHIIRQKRTGLVPVAPDKPAAPPLRSAPLEKTSPSYANRHYLRAQELAKKGNLSLAIQELRDAIKIDATQSDYHALLGRIYLLQNMRGMATVHLRQALKLDPKNPLAVKYGQTLKLTPNASANGQQLSQNGKSAQKAKSNKLFGLFARKR